MPLRQSTTSEPIEFSGVGVHSGEQVSLAIYPAEADSGISFLRSDLGDDIEIPASLRSVCGTELCTMLGTVPSASIATVEHLIAALSGLGIDNAVVELDGPEVPILDGSAAPFVEAIRQSGIRKLDAPRRFIKILKPIRVESGRSVGELTPYDGFSVDIRIDFDCDTIGTQQIVLDITPASFADELARARTFGFMSDVERLWGTGYALGASLDNTVVLGVDHVMNPEGLRWSDEFVRHKALDAIGDLALAGAPMLGRYRSVCGGHHLNYQILKALAADRSAWTWVEAVTRRDSGHAEISPAVALPVFGPDLS